MENGIHVHTALCTTVEMAGFASFFLFGLAGSLHCVGMCGPLSSLACRPGESPASSLFPYQFFRMAIYAGLAAMVWGLGLPFRLGLPLPALAALVCLPLLAYALVPHEWAPAWMGRLHTRLGGGLARLGPVLRGSLMGFLTPLLPCGLLYAALAAAIAAPSALHAASWMAAFAAGTLPLLAASQAGFTLLPAFSRGPWPSRLRRGTAVVAAAGVLSIALIH